MPTLLAILPHPDDESYAMGATLARCADAGVDVQVLCLTRGESGVDRIRKRKGSALGAVRKRELRAACDLLGLPAPIVLDLPDGGLEDVPDGEARVAEVIAQTGARVLLTLGRDGVYGHRDHLAVTRWVDAASESVDRVLHVAFPRGLFQPMYRGLRDRGFPGVVPGMTPEQFGLRPGEADLVVDVRPVQDRKRSAMAAHSTQSSGLADRLLPVDLTPLFLEEWFVLTAGELPPDAVLPTDGLR
jgi:LmbE family N-acetylglucosaminyl deacetylase